MRDRSKILSAIKNNTLRSKRFFFTTVSGIVTTNPGMIRRIDRDVPQFGLITTKSFQINPNQGNREPVIVEPLEGSFGNAVGLRNPGMIEGLKDLEKLVSVNPLSAILNVSVAGNSIMEFVTLVKHFEKIADIIELNLSCPHASDGYGMTIGKDPELVYKYVKEIREVTDAPIFPKLTPNVDSISEIACAAVEGGADGITAINTAGPELYLEPVSGKSLLQNSTGNRGGKSGRWIKDLALKKINSVRQAVGPDIPIVGMGGVENGDDVRNMIGAGADVVGIGSLFASVDPGNWKAFFKALKADVFDHTDTASAYRIRKRKMEYVPHSITKVKDLSGGVRMLELDGKIPFDAGQFAFLWIPGTGEKPFSIVQEEPPVFLIREKGSFTSRIMELFKGDRIFVRSAYGKRAPYTDRAVVVIVAGGTGIAAALKLAEAFHKQGKEVHTFHGMSMPGQEVMEDDFLQWGTYTPVPDNGVSGRAVDFMMESMCSRKKPFDDKYRIENAALYTIGPDPFMEKAVEGFVHLGGRKDEVYLSVETMTRCGIGLCGECECGGHLTCREGTFVAWGAVHDD